MQLLGQWFALSLFDCDDQATDLCCYQNPHKVYIDKRWEKIYSWRHDSDGCHHYGSTYSAKTQHYKNDSKCPQCHEKNMLMIQCCKSKTKGFKRQFAGKGSNEETSPICCY